MVIAVIGDCLLDITVRPLGPMRPGADAPAAIRLAPGGQGANVAVRLARRGASVRLVAPLGDDPVGALLRDALEAEGVGLAPLPAARSGSVAVLLDEAAERSMLSDRVIASSPGDELPELLAGVDWVHVSGYALRDDHARAVAKVLAARPDSVRVSLGGGSAPRAEAAAFGEMLDAVRPDLVILSAEEAAALGRRRPGTGAAIVVTTAGSGGSWAEAGGERIEVPAAALDDPPLDATGAGDAYAAALIDALANNGEWPPPIAELRSAMQLASRLGAETARVEGAQGRVPSEGGAAG